MHCNASGHYGTTATGGETVRASVPFPLQPESPLDLAGNRQLLMERATLALDLCWRARTHAERALMADRHPLLTNRAGGRDISGLNAYKS